MRYAAYGLNFESELPFPEFLPGTNGQVDVTIRYGEVPRSLPHPRGGGRTYQAQPGKFLQKMKRVARYLVLDGREVWIQRAWSGSEEDVRGWLLGTALAALLQQRGVLTLHASAVRTGEGAVVFAGACGSGKSTLLGEMLKRGYAMLADDITGVVLEAPGRPLALPAYPMTQLSAASAGRLRQPGEGLARVEPATERFYLPVSRFCHETVPIRAIYALSVHDQPEIRLERIRGVAKFQIGAACTYGIEYLDGLGLRGSHFESVAAAVGGVRVAGVTRPGHSFLLEELADRIEEDLVKSASFCAGESAAGS